VSDFDKKKKNAIQDKARESVVILLGTLARHMEPGSPEIMVILDQLLDALKTPSESVQKSVSKCLIALAPALKDNAEKLVASLLDKTINATSSYSERRGAAFGLAGLVKGLGISSLKEVQCYRYSNQRRGR